MNSIVLELQKEALSSDAGISDLLRKAYLVAVKLNQDDFARWLNHEMNGYPASVEQDLPHHRTLRGQVKYHNPFNGYQDIVFKHESDCKKWSEMQCRYSCAEIEFMLNKSKHEIVFNFLGESAGELMEASKIAQRPSLHIPDNSFVGILESTRNTILKWSLKLEGDGILGDELTFTQEEKDKAISITYNTNNFFSTVSNTQVQQATAESDQTIEQE